MAGEPLETSGDSFTEPSGTVSPTPRRTTHRSRRRRFWARRGVEVLPTVVTLRNLFSGFLAMVFDAVDGKVARMTGATSWMGAELDPGIKAN